MKEIDGVSCGLNFFSEKAQVIEILGDLFDPDAAFRDSKLFASKFETLKGILSKYQEQPILLNPFMSDLLQPLSSAFLRFGLLLQDRLSSLDRLHELCKVIQLICSVRGFKHVTKFFPHEVSHLELCIFLFQLLDAKDCNTWETRYIMLLWLSILCLIPFDICSLDSSLATTTLLLRPADEERKSAGVEASKLFVNIIALCGSYLKESGPVREAAAFCLSSLLSRPDMERSALLEFIGCSRLTVDTWAAGGDQMTREMTSGYFEVVGIVQSFCQIFKRGERNILRGIACDMLIFTRRLFSLKDCPTILRKLLCKLTQRVGSVFLPLRMAPWRYSRGQRSLLDNLRGVVHSQPCAIEGGLQVSEEEEQNEELEYSSQLEDVVETLLECLKDRDTVVRWSAAKGIGRVTMRLPRDFAGDVFGFLLDAFKDPEADQAWHGGCLALAELARRGLLLPENFGNDVVPVIQSALQFDRLRGQHSVGAHVRDAACYVCWSLARAYAPAVLSAHMGDLSAAMLVSALYDREINCRRAAAAAYQENVGRQGSQAMPSGIEIMTVADYFSLGNRVQAFLKIAPQVANIDASLVSPFIKHLKSFKLVHWDEEIRILSSKALANLFVMSGDWAAASSTLHQLLPDCTSNDLATRHGCILGVAELLLAVSLSPGACTSGFVLAQDVQLAVVDVIPSLDKARLYRGRGAESTRIAACYLVESISRSNLNVPLKLKLSLIAALNENIKQPFEIVQEAAQSALRHFLHVYFGDETTPASNKLKELTILSYLDALGESENVAHTRGAALALGVLPPRLLVAAEESVMTALEKAGRPSATIGTDPDAETKRNSIMSIVEIVEKLEWRLYLTPEMLRRILTMLISFCEDYTVDSRGDVGSWSRSAALRGIERVLKVTFRMYGASGRVIEHVEESYWTSSFGPVLTQDIEEIISIECGSFALQRVSHSIAFKRSTLRKINKAQLSNIGNDALRIMFEDVVSSSVKVILKQLGEKLDSVREVAGNVLVGLLSSASPVIDFVADKTVLLKVFVDTEESRDWSQPRHVFPLLVEAMVQSETYFSSILSGIVISVGSLSETINKHSAEALLGLCALWKRNDSSMSRLSQALFDMFDTHRRVDRVTVPLLKTLDLIIRHGAFDVFAHSPTAAAERFAVRIFNSINAEQKQCKNVSKMRVLCDLFCQLVSLLVAGGSDLGGDKPVCAASLKALVMLSGHSFPVIRKHAAELLYLLLSSTPEVAGNIDMDKSQEYNTRVARALELLATFVWDGSLLSSRQARYDLCEILGLPPPPRAEKTSRAVLAQVQDEFDSYESLVREAGY